MLADHLDVPKTARVYDQVAVEFARQVSDGIVLVDGVRLTSLMIEYGVGVSTQRTLRIVRVDTDFSEDA